MPFDQWLELLFPLGAALVALWLYFRSSRRSYWKIAAGLSLVLLVVAFIYPWFDHRHVIARIGEGGLETVEGPVSGHKRFTERRFLGTSKGVGVTSTSRYSETTYEYFYVGDRFFSFIVGGFPSYASFTNVGDPPIAITDGMTARVSYFADSWHDNQIRIVKLALGPKTARAGLIPAAAPAPADLTGLPAEFGAFWKEFGNAVAKGDAAAVKGFVAFPFLFGGHDVGADEFDSLWMSLFAEPLRPCLAAAKPVREEDRFTVFCGAYGYYFGRTSAGWKLVEFGADGEEI
jgi:hypothetical protein